MSVRPSVCHTLALSQNDASQDHEIFTDGYSRRFPGEGASNDSGVVDNGNFQRFISSETLEMGPALLHSDTQSVVSFSVIPKRVTLNDLEWLFRVKFCFRAGLVGSDRATFENNCVTINKHRHILSAVQISGMDSSFWRYKVCADIRSGSLERRR